jgi:hypothetical protein
LVVRRSVAHRQADRRLEVLRRAGEQRRESCPRELSRLEQQQQQQRLWSDRAEDKRGSLDSSGRESFLGTEAVYNSYLRNPRTGR